MWQRDAANFEIDGHYPVRELWARAQSCWQSILNSDGISILVVAHNAVNQALVATATGLCRPIALAYQNSSSDSVHGRQDIIPEGHRKGFAEVSAYAP